MTSRIAIRCAVAAAVACVLPVTVARVAADPYDHFPNPPVHMIMWFPTQDVNVYMSPRRPHAGEEMTFSFEVMIRGTEQPLAGPLTVALDREGLFGHVTHVAPVQDVRHDAGFPGHYTLRVVPPKSGLYMLHVASRTLGPDAKATVGLGVWPAGLNLWILVPAFSVTAMFAYGMLRAKRAAR